MTSKIIGIIILVISALGIFKATGFLLKNGYYGGLLEGYVLLGLIISFIFFITSAIFLYKRHKKNIS